MGAKGATGRNYRQPCEYRNKECPFISDNCKHEQCGFYCRVQANFSIEETIEELRWEGLNNRQLKNIKNNFGYLSDAVEFRKQVFFEVYKPKTCSNP